MDTGKGAFYPRCLACVWRCYDPEVALLALAGDGRQSKTSRKVDWEDWFFLRFAFDVVAPCLVVSELLAELLGIPEELDVVLGVVPILHAVLRSKLAVSRRVADLANVGMKNNCFRTNGDRVLDIEAAWTAEVRCLSECAIYV